MIPDNRVYDMTAEEQIKWADKELAKLSCIYTEEEIEKGVDIKDYIQCNKLAVEAFKLIKSNNQNTTDEYNDDMLICDTLKALCKGKPLTDITDNDVNEWNFINADDYGREEWQSKRCLTLTKYVEPDGTTSYFDSEYAMTVNLSALSQTFKSYWDSNINKLMQKLFPITMPYNVTNHPIAYIKSTEDALYHNIFELVYVVVYTGSNWNRGMKIDIGKYYKGTEEISYTEYLRCISSI